MDNFCTMQTTIKINDTDIDVELNGNYIPKTVCNSSGGHCEYEGNCIENMQVFARSGHASFIDLTSILPDEVLEKLERSFIKHVTGGLR